jgi:large subunit ribosomal protein L23
MTTLIYQKIRKPVITEKSTRLKGESNILCFQVARDVTKIQVKEYIEKLFNVKVENVRICNVRGKVKRMGRFSGKRADWKKAYVKLRPGEKGIEYFEGL